MNRDANQLLYLQYGCGWSAPAGWRNFDASPTLRFERIPFVGRFYTRNAMRFPVEVEYGDIIRGLPVPDNFFAGVYCSHVLEHLSLLDFRAALSNTHKLLRQGGTFRLVMPDLEYLVAVYSQRQNPDAALAFMRDTALGREQRPKQLKSLLTDYFGNSAHLWLWDYKSLEIELAAAGFVNIRRAAFNDSEDMYFSGAEDYSRWQNQLGAECKKP